MSWYQDHQEESHASDAGHGLTMEELPSFIQHHIGDAKEIEFLGGHWSLEALSVAPIQLGGLSIDFSMTRHLLVMLIVGLLLVLSLVPIARRLRATSHAQKAPSGFANGVEALVLYFRNEVVRRNIGHDGDGYTPFILTLFVFVLGMNLIGLTPLGITPTSNVSVTAALAIISFIVVEISGMRSLGFSGYAKTVFFMPPGVPTIMQPVILLIMVPVEAIGKLTKPFALAVRLMANMVAGHSMVLAIMGLILVYQSLLTGSAIVVAVGAIMILEVFVACLQAYIFAMLVSVFIGLIRHAH
jgi:F-type H+-transporting ATPase subunit a